MARVIHKIRLEQETTEIIVPEGSFKILEIHQQDNQPTIWYERSVDMIIPKKVTLKLLPTGGEVPDNFSYQGTVFLHDTQLVYHVYSK